MESSSSLSEDTFAMPEENESSQSTKPKKMKKNSSEDILAQAVKVLNESTDDLSISGQYVATELRNITSSSLLRRTKRAITLAIMQAQVKEEQLSFSGQPSVLLGSTPILVTCLEEENQAIFSVGVDADVSAFNINTIVDEC